MPDKNPAALKQAAKANMQRKCSTENCYGRRNSAFGKLCSPCARKMRLHGTTDIPHATSQNYKAYSRQIKIVTQLLSRDPHNDAVFAAKGFIKEWLYQSQTAPTGFGDGDRFKAFVPGRLYVRALADADVKPIEILIVTAAAWLYARMNPQRFDGRTAITRHLGKAMIRVRGWNEKTDGRIKDSAATEIGEQLWRALVKFYIRVETLLRNRGEHDAALQESLMAGLPEDMQLTPAELKFVKHRKAQILAALGMTEGEAINQMNRDNESQGETS